MKISEIKYHNKGNIEQLCKDLRDKGFGVPYDWNSSPNSFYKSKNISPFPDTISAKIDKRGKITDNEVIGDIEFEKGHGHSLTEFTLTIYFNQFRSNDLEKFANNYIPSTKQT